MWPTVKSWTSVSVCSGVSVSVELSLVEVIIEAMEVGVSSSSLADGVSGVASLASCGKDSWGGPSELCSWNTHTQSSYTPQLSGLASTSSVHILLAMFTSHTNRVMIKGQTILWQHSMSLRLSTHDRKGALDAGCWADPVLRARCSSTPLSHNLCNLKYELFNSCWIMPIYTLKLHWYMSGAAHIFTTFELFGEL